MTIERPRCPNCQSTAILARTTRGSSGFDIGTFQCPACDLVHQLVVDLIDPMKSLETLGWLVTSKYWPGNGFQTSEFENRTGPHRHKLPAFHGLSSAPRWDRFFGRMILAEL